MRTIARFTRPRFRLGLAALFPLLVGLLAAFVAYGRGYQWRSAVA